MGKPQPPGSGSAPATRTIVTGATSQIGGFLIPLLLESGHHVTALSRSSQGQNDQAGVEWLQLDIAKEPDFSPIGGNARVVIHLAPLPLLPPLLGSLAGLSVKRIIAFGSTSAFTKVESKDSGEVRLAESLLEAENTIANHCTELGIAWTVFRPTIIYGGGRNSAIAFIARHTRRFGFFPVVAGGKGLRQPVHAADLADACMMALGCTAAHNRAYDLPGGETLSYREMVVRIFRHQDRSPRIANIPLVGFRAMLGLLRLLPGNRHLTAEMANRMNQNLVFDAGDAQRDFAYRPRGFLRGVEGGLLAPGEGDL